MWTILSKWKIKNLSVITEHVIHRIKNHYTDYIMTIIKFQQLLHMPIVVTLTFQHYNCCYEMRYHQRKILHQRKKGPPY